MNKKLLIEQMEMLNINYIDFNGYNEVDQYSNDDTIILNLFDCLYNEFIRPINLILSMLGIDWVIFHYIGYDANAYIIYKDIDGTEYEIVLSENMQEETYNFIQNIMNDNK